MLARRLFLKLGFQTRVDSIQVRFAPSTPILPVIEIPNKVDKLNYNLTHIPVQGSLLFFLNGVLLTPIVDYTISSNRVNLNSYYNTLLETNNVTASYYRS